MLLLHAPEQEHSVVGREPEDHSEDDDERGRLQRARGAEPQQLPQVAPLEGPHEQAEGGADGEDVHNNGHYGEQHRARHGEQHDERDQYDQPEHGRQM